MFSESFAEAWRARYGVDPGFELPELAPFLRHRSVRDFAPEPIGERTLSALIAAAQSASTSSNLQLWSVVSVDAPESRAAFAELAGNQRQILSAARFLVFCADHHRLRRAGARVGEDCEGLDYAEFGLMAFLDAALAAERLVCAAEALGLGACYIGAVRNDLQRSSALLGLPSGVAPLFGLCLGWPEAGCAAEIKPRLDQAVVWHRERYDPQAEVAAYDERMRPFYVSQGMKGEVTWSMRSARRVDGRHMTGREVLKAFFERVGFWIR
ncbi:MAG: nitroreductase family protein [Fimbriimonadales bacterium]|nr:nitroreductase family protein [Fimbriimonadales bacterium]